MHHMDIDRSELRTRRDALGLSRAALARSIKNPSTGKPVPGHSIYRWESGRVTPSPVLLARWAAALDRLERKQ